MNWVFFAALIVASSAAKLDRAYLPPASAASAGGSPGSLLAPLAKSEAQSLPIGSFVNEHDGVVVDVASVGTRASQSGLGGPRMSYGSTDSKVGDAAFRGTQQGPPKFVNNEPAVLDSDPDLSAFHQPSKPSRTSFQISRDNGAHITKYHNDIEKDRYSYGFEADNGIKAEEKGIVTNGVQAEGGFSYVGDDGKVYSVAYTADTNGYRPVGSHLPTPPPIPVEILKALEQNSRDEAAGVSEDGSYDAQKYNTGDYTKSDANKYNDRQTNKFSIRPESNIDNSGTLFNNNQGAFKPNIIGSLGAKDNKKSEIPTISTQISGLGNNLNNRNNFNQEQINGNAGIATRNEFLQQKLQGSISSNLGSSLINKESSNAIPPKPLSQQDLQESVTPGQDNSRPSSYDTSFSTVVNDNGSGSIQQSVTNSELEGNRNEPLRTDQSFRKPTQGFTQSFGIKNTESKLQTKPLNVNIPIVSKFINQNNSQNLFTTQVFNNQMKPNLNNRFSSLQSSSGPFSTFGLAQTTDNNDKISSTSSFSPATKPIYPSKQPERILTTPFESFATTNNAEFPTTFGINQNHYSGSNFPGLTTTSTFNSIPSTQQDTKTKTSPQTQFSSASHNDFKVTNSPFSFSSQPSHNFDLQNQQYKPTENKFQMTSPFSSKSPNNINLSESTQDPNFIQSTQVNNKANDLDTSSFNKPSKPFIDSISPEINVQQFPTTSFDQVGGSIVKQDTKFPSKYNDFTSTSYSQGITGINRQTNSPAASVSQSIASENKGSYQTNGITQASISPFSSFFPTSLNIKASDTFKPFQQSTQNNGQSQTRFFEPSRVTSTGLLQSSFTDKANLNGNSNSQTKQYDNKIYDYSKPVSSSGNVATNPLGHLGTQFTMSFRFGENENITSDQNEQTSLQIAEIPTNSQFSTQNQNLDRKTSPLQQFNDKLTTSSNQYPTDVSNNQNQDIENTSQFQIYEYTKPSQSLISTSSKEQYNKNKNQESQFTEQFNKQSTTAFTGSYTETEQNFQKEPQLSTQFDQGEFERRTELPEFSKTSSTFDSTIYQYTKPVTSFLTTSKKEKGNNSPLPQKDTTVGIMSTNFGPQHSDLQEFGIQSFQNRFNSQQSTSSQYTQGIQPTRNQFMNKFSTPFPSTSQQQLGNNLNSENQETVGEIYNYENPNKRLSSSEQANPLDKGQNSQFNSQFNKLKIQNKESDMASLSGMMTTFHNQPNSMSTFSDSPIENYNLQKRPQQDSQLGEIYEYSKPAQTLTTPTKNNILSQNRNQFGQKFDQVNSKPNTFNQNPSDDTSTTQDGSMSTPSMVTQTNSYSEDKFTKPDRTTVTQTTFNSGINSKPIGTRPQFEFQSACCRGFQNQNHQVPQVTQSTPKNTESSDLKSNLTFEAQKLTTQGLSTIEDFGAPRKPPSFDEKGYHY